LTIEISQDNAAIYLRNNLYDLLPRFILECNSGRIITLAVAKYRPIVLRMTYGIATEPITAENPASGMPWPRDHAAHGYYRRGNFGGSDFRCVLWRNDTYPKTKVYGEVNKKCPARNTTVQLSTPTTDPECTINFVADGQTDEQTDRQTDDSIIGLPIAEHATVRSANSWFTFTKVVK